MLFQKPSISVKNSTMCLCRPFCENFVPLDLRIGSYLGKKALMAERLFAFCGQLQIRGSFSPISLVFGAAVSGMSDLPRPSKNGRFWPRAMPHLRSNA